MTLPENGRKLGRRSWALGGVSGAFGTRMRMIGIKTPKHNAPRCGGKPLKSSILKNQLTRPKLTKMIMPIRASFRDNLFFFCIFFSSHLLEVSIKRETVKILYKREAERQREPPSTIKHVYHQVGRLLPFFR